MKNFILLLLIILSGCNSSRLVNSYRNDQQPPISSNRLLIIGITPNIEARKAFELGVQKALKKEKVTPVPSFEYFKNDKLLHDLSKTEIAELEKQLLLDEFNAVLLARIISIEKREMWADDMANFIGFYNNFKQDYFENQFINDFESGDQSSTIFHTETAVYHISEGDGKNIVWRGTIDIVDPESIKFSIKEYIKLLLSAFEKENVFKK